jgi:hypothetical protein
MRGRVWVLGLLLLAAGAGGASAQTFQGGLRGQVRDASGVVPGATVTLTNEGTNVAREVATNQAGEYVFPALQPGTYTLRVAVPGFKTFENKGIRVGTQQIVTLDVVLEIGELQETITVASEAPLIELSTASTGEVLERKELEALPAPGRAAFLIGVTVPTVIATGDAQFNRQQDQTNASLVSLGGGARRANNYIIDGVPISDMRNRSVVNPTIEGLEEVKVQVHTFDAEMGRTGGGVFNVTAKSGTNTFRGSGFFQTRPVWGLENNWFNARAGIPKLKDQYYRLYGGALGGPVVRNRTFFHFATEGYRSATTRNGALIFPTELERRGDFSQSFDRNGNLLVIHDPVTRQPFPGNVIPADRMDPVGLAIVNLMPKPDENRSNQTANYRRTARIVDAADQFMTKGDHKFSDTVSLSGLYIYNKTDEPYNVYWDTNLFQDPNAAPLKRRIHVVAVNNTWVPNDSSVLTLRYGYTSFVDDCGIDVTPFDVKTLGFAPAFTNDIRISKHPRINIDDFGEIGVNQLGTASFTDMTWKSWGVNGAYSKLVGTHTLKVGADYRWIGLDTQPFGQGSGTFTFTRRFTASATGVGGSPLASLLLGTPVSGSADISTFSQYFLNYYGAYAQDDWRVKSNLTINYGLRLEHEDGLGEKNNQFTVGFDQNAINPLSGRVPGLGELRGGLIYAGVNGAKTTQGDPPAVKVSPRVGVVYSLSPRAVIRGGYGVFWAPWNYQFPGTTNYGNIGFSRTTTMQQSSDTGPPLTYLRNPFPNGLEQPVGSSLGLLTGVGGSIDVIDQNKKAPYVQQISVDFQRELGASMAVSIGYMHARGDDLGLGGTNDGIVNINQIRPEVARNYTVAQLLESVPNPFFGVAGAGGFASRPTIQRGQLLRPFPQFGDINVRQMTAGKSRYHAMVLKFDKRLTGGWGGRFNYTWSNLKDNQFGESNHYNANRSGRPQNNYDLEDEFATGLLDTPHRVVLAPIVELPFGQGKRWANGRLADLLVGGWTISAVATFESGFPTPVIVSASQSQSLTGLFGGIELRPIYTGVDPNTPGDLYERIGSATPWANRAAYALPPPGTFSDVERTDTRLRSPFRKNLDMVFNKAFRTGGSTRAEVRIEMLNITNTPKFRDFTTAIDAGTFGQITRQSGFSRITQISLRFSF